MYIPAHFAETRPEALQRIMRAHPLGMLVTHTSTGLDADHIPFEFDAGAGTHGALIAHVARANTLWQRCPTGTPAMVVFRGAEAYILNSVLKQPSLFGGQTCGSLRNAPVTSVRTRV